MTIAINDPFCFIRWHQQTPAEEGDWHFEKSSDLAILSAAEAAFKDRSAHWAAAGSGIWHQCQIHDGSHGTSYDTSIFRGTCFINNMGKVRHEPVWETTAMSRIALLSA